MNAHFSVLKVSMQSLFLLSLMGCGDRALNTPDDAGQRSDGMIPDAHHQHDGNLTTKPDATPISSCVVARRQTECCDDFVAATVEQVKLDPCLSSEQVPEASASCSVLPGPCTRECPTRPPSYLVAPDGQGGCEFVDECTKDTDCVIGEDCRSKSDCCSCGTAFPLSYAEDDVCILLESSSSSPAAACGQRCPDFCGGEGGDGWQPQKAVCRTSSAGTLNICQAEPVTPPVQTGYLLWQAPLGYANKGPALEIMVDGRTHFWKETAPLTPHATAAWDLETFLTIDQVNQLFALLSAVDWSKLPHQKSTGAECYPSFYLEPSLGGAAPAVAFTYDHPQDLLPELQGIYALLGQALAGYPFLLPYTYCQATALESPCGNYGGSCNANTEVCVIRWSDIPEKETCEKVPSNCLGDRSCACIGQQFCDTFFYQCLDGDSYFDNELNCSCNCGG